MPRCDRCEFWGRGEEPIVALPRGSKKKHCGLYVYDNNREDNQSYLEAGDCASSEGSLWTEPEFFCARYVRKDDGQSATD